MEASMDETSVQTVRPVHLSWNIASYALGVCESVDYEYKRTLSLQSVSSQQPAQIELLFVESSGMQLESVESDYIGVFLPMTMLSDILYVLSNWKDRYMAIDYDPVTKKLFNFGISGIWRS